MSGLKEIAKNGWHPKSKDGGFKEKCKQDFKGLNQVTDWMGKGKDSKTTEHRIARPIQSLRDPASFGPPPKKFNNFREEDAIATQISDDTGSQTVTSSRDDEREVDVKTRLNPPPLPYRARNLETTSQHLVSLNIVDKSNFENEESSIPAKSKPRLPPRPPPRENLSLDSASLSNNQSQLQVSKLKINPSNIMNASEGIRERFKSSSTPTSISKISPTLLRSNNEHQNDFLHASTSRSATGKNTDSGTSFEEKKAAAKTISSFRNDPSSVSFSDVKKAAGTANNFRERHGDQVKSGLQWASKVNDKYGISDKVNSLEGTSKANDKSTLNMNCRVGDSNGDTLVKKKPPPPPPKKIDPKSVRDELPLVPTWTKPNLSSSLR